MSSRLAGSILRAGRGPWLGPDNLQCGSVLERFPYEKMQDRGIDLALLCPGLKLLNIPEDSANDLQKGGIRNFEEIFQCTEDRHQ